MYICHKLKWNIFISLINNLIIWAKFYMWKFVINFVITFDLVMVFYQMWRHEINLKIYVNTSNVIFLL